MIWLSNDLKFKWVRCQLIWASSELVVNWFELQVIWLSMMRASNDFGCLLNWTSSEVVVNWFEIQAIWLSIGLRFKWVGCQLIWDSKELVANCIEIQVNLVVNRCVIRLILFVSWFEIQLSWLSIDLRFKWFGCQSIWDSKLFCETSFKIETLQLKNKAFLRDFLQNWNFEAQEQSFSARPPSKLKLWSSKIEAFVRDFLQKWSFDDQKRSIPARFLQTWNFEDQKRSISARLPSKLKLWSSKTKPFCETSFKNLAFKLKNEAFLRDFLQKWRFETQKRSFCARLPSKLKLWRSKTKHFCETSFKIDMLSRHFTSEFQYVLVIFKWMLQKYCACHEKVEPRHTKSCNCHAKWSLQSKTSVTGNLQPFHGFSVGGFKYRHHRARNHCACHAKRIISDPLQIHHACQRFCNPHELLRLPRIFQRGEIPAPATRNTLWTSKNIPSPWCFNDFDFQIALARRRGANFAKLNFQKCSEHAAWCLFFIQIALARRRGANFVDVNFQKCSDTASF